MTPALEQFLRRASKASQTLVGIGPGAWDSDQLTRDQETAKPFFTTKTLYRIYTEDTGDVVGLVNRYFEGATVYRGVGLDTFTQSGAELAIIVEIVSSKPDALQRVFDLAGDIQVVNNQILVLVTRQSVDTFEVKSHDATR